MRTWDLRTKEFWLKPDSEYLDKNEMYANCETLRLSQLKLLLQAEEVLQLVLPKH